MEHHSIVTSMAKLAPPESPLMIGLDWGTSSMRAFLIGKGGAVLAERNGPNGIMAVHSDSVDPRGDFFRIAQSTIGDWLAKYGQPPVVACGMVGSTQGIAEVGYLDLPTDLEDLGKHLTADTLGAIDLHIVPGLQKTARATSAPDVIRGEETQLLGLLAAEQKEQRTVVLPGTHSKWVTSEGTHIIDFSTSMSGEIFGLLSTSSILARLAEPTEDFHPQAFDWGVQVGAEEPATLTSSLFSARTWVLDGRLLADEVTDYISGMLIGSEAATQLTPPGPSGPVIVCGSKSLSQRYSRALKRLGRETVVADSRAAATGLYRIAELSGLVPTKENVHV